MTGRTTKCGGVQVPRRPGRMMRTMMRSRRDAFEGRFPKEKVMAAPLRALRYTSAGGRHTELRYWK